MDIEECGWPSGEDVGILNLGTWLSIYFTLVIIMLPTSSRNTHTFGRLQQLGFGLTSRLARLSLGCSLLGPTLACI